MIKPLRKRHLQIWVLLAILLPLGIISATVARRYFPPTNLIQPQSETVLPVIIMQKETPQFAIQLRGLNSSEVKQLLWINKQPLTIPTAAIYKVSSDRASISGANYIGRIESLGSYTFNIPPHRPQAPLHFIVYDFIHKKIVERVNLYAD
jgi:hypothetical protein